MYKIKVDKLISYPTKIYSNIAIFKKQNKLLSESFGVMLNL